MIEKREAIKYFPEDQESDSREHEQARYANEAGYPTTAPNSSARSPAHGQTKPVDEETLQSPCYEPTEYTPLLPSETYPKATTSWFHTHFPKFAILSHSPRLFAAIYGCFTYTMIFASIDSILPLFVKRTFRWTATGAGSIFLTITCPSLFGTVFGALADRYGSRLVSLMGLGLTTLNLGLMGLVEKNRIGDIVLLCVTLVFTGNCRSSFSFFSSSASSSFGFSSLLNLFLHNRYWPQSYSLSPCRRRLRYRRHTRHCLPGQIWQDRSLRPGLFAYGRSNGVRDHSGANSCRGDVRED